jgi:AcrR family transcriptional regulator
MGAARDDLLDKTVAYVAEHGLADLSLRQLAAGIGTSHRMLNFHFGSREGLLAAIVASIEEQQRVALEELAAEAASPTALVRAQWAQLTDPALRPAIVLFFEVLALALQRRPGTDGFLERLTEPWLDQAAAIAEQMDLAMNPADLLLGIAVVRGLLLEVAAGADVDDATASLDRFLALWEEDQPGGGP